MIFHGAPGPVLVQGGGTRTRTFTVGARISLAAESESFRAKGHASWQLVASNWDWDALNTPRTYRITRYILVYTQSGLAVLRYLCVFESTTGLRLLCTDLSGLQLFHRFKTGVHLRAEIAFQILLQRLAHLLLLGQSRWPCPSGTWWTWWGWTSWRTLWMWMGRTDRVQASLHRHQPGRKLMVFFRDCLWIQQLLHGVVTELFGIFPKSLGSLCGRHTANHRLARSTLAVAWET